MLIFFSLRKRVTVLLFGVWTEEEDAEPPCNPCRQHRCIHTKSEWKKIVSFTETVDTVMGRGGDTGALNLSTRLVRTIQHLGPSFPQLPTWALWPPKLPTVVRSSMLQLHGGAVSTLPLPPGSSPTLSHGLWGFMRSSFSLRSSQSRHAPTSCPPLSIRLFFVLFHNFITFIKIIIFYNYLLNLSASARK